MEIRGIRLGRSGNPGGRVLLSHYAACFVATDQESKLGQFALITSAVSLVSYWACGKWFKPKFRKTGMLVGSILMLLVIMPLLFTVNYTTLLVLGIGTSLFIPLYMMPAISASFDLMGVNQENVEKRVELVVLRELSLTIGRITGLLVFILVLSFRQDTLTITLLLLFLGRPHRILAVYTKAVSYQRTSSLSLMATM